MKSFAIVVLGLALATGKTHAADAQGDPYLWLEEIDSARALDWVHAQNERAQRELEAQPGFTALRARLLDVLGSKERIPYVSKLGAYYYNFWRDAQHIRGIWRRTTLAEYRKATPAWEIVLDLDQLASREKENWVWSGAQCVRPEFDRCLIDLSRGGGDAVVTREFDLNTKDFVSGGFALPEGKHYASWRNHDELFVGPNLDKDSMTTSGYPRTVRVWTRGAPLASAPLLFRGKPTDVSASGVVIEQPGFRKELIVRTLGFYRNEYFLLQGAKLTKLDVPQDADIDSFRDQLLIQLRSDFTAGGRRYPSGALLATSWRGFLKGKRDFEVLYEPSPRRALGSIRATRNFVLMSELDNVRSKIYTLEHTQEGWQRSELSIPSIGTVGATPVDEFESDEYFLTVNDFTTPNSLFLGSLARGERELLKQLPAMFDANGLEVAQYEAQSKDGTRVPYFVVARSDIKLDGANPTLLYGYGGFEVPYRPAYSPTLGAGWLERGGVYVLANIRGGGEFGAQWHQAAVKDKRQNAYDDFIAVAEDLIARKITSPAHLGAMGGSNGGLLMGVMLTQRPDLFSAIVCQVPLLDMRRYHKLLAGASWMSEYGDPDKPREWAYIGKYSPYQNLRADRRYPRVLFTTSTRDDRVHPGHARKMAAKMAAMGHDFLYYENTEGGHGGAANHEQQAYMTTLAYTFLWKELRPVPQ